MSLAYQNKLFVDKYMNNTDNIFEAVNNLICDSNKVANQYHGMLSSSESLSYTLTDSFPTNFNSRIPILLIESKYIKQYINESLSYINDVDVKKSVILSIKNSLLNKKLEFWYCKNLSLGQKSRVKIISRLIWNNIYPLKGKIDE